MALYAVGLVEGVDGIKTLQFRQVRLVEAKPLLTKYVHQLYQHLEIN